MIPDSRELAATADPERWDTRIERLPDRWETLQPANRP